MNFQNLAKWADPVLLAASVGVSSYLANLANKADSLSELNKSSQFINAGLGLLVVALAVSLANLGGYKLNKWLSLLGVIAGVIGLALLIVVAVNIREEYPEEFNVVIAAIILGIVGVFVLAIYSKSSVSKGEADGVHKGVVKLQEMLQNLKGKILSGSSKKNGGVVYTPEASEASGSETSE